MSKLPPLELLRNVSIDIYRGVETIEEAGTYRTESLQNLLFLVGQAMHPIIHSHRLSSYGLVLTGDMLALAKTIVDISVQAHANSGISRERTNVLLITLECLRRHLLNLKRYTASPPHHVIESYFSTRLKSNPWNTRKCAKKPPQSPSSS